jgi:uncharacterized membrane protein
MEGQSEAMRISLMIAPLLALAYWVMMRARNRILGLFVLLVVGVALYLLEHEKHWGLAVAYGIPHAAVYLFLLWFFGRTLLSGKEPLITRLARRVHGSLPPDMEAYTRGVTLAWCVFFAAQVIVSALLFKYASLNIWSLFITIMNFPLLVLMFVVEYAYRLVRHRDFPHASILKSIQAFTGDAALSKSPKAP